MKHWILTLIILIAPMLRGADWPIFRGNRGLTGVAAGAVPDKPMVLWKFETKASVKASAVVGDGRVYFGNDDGMFFALNLANGKKVWEFDSKDPIEAAALFLDGRVFFGNSFGVFFAVDAKTGEELWKFEANDLIAGSANWTLAPNGKDKYLLVGSHDGFLYCLNAKDGKKIWEYGCDQPINGSPALSGRRTMFGGCDGLLHLIDIVKGKRQKAVDVQSYVAGSVAADAGRAYVGHSGSEFLCIDLKTEKVVWTYKDRLFSYEASPALTKDRVIFGGQDKRLHCVRRDNGKVVWTFSTRGQVNSSPVVCGGKVIVGSNDGRLYIVRLKDGKLLSSFETDDGITASPAVVDGKIIIGSEDGTVYCLGAKKK
jgi:outer membrane protein assembly factor BamB